MGLGARREEKERIAETDGTCYNGHYYGKILFHPVYLDTNSTDRKISKFRVKIDMDINKMEDDRNLTSPY